MMRLTRRAALALPIALAACGGEERGDEQASYEPLRYNYLPPIQLNVASIDIEQRFIPAHVPPDVSAQAPIQPVDALRAMASDRLQAFGTSNKAVFAILNAALTEVDETVRGAFSVSVSIVDSDGQQRGFAEAHVERTRTGPMRNLRQVLYDLTKSLMDDMNVEFEYQIRHNLRDWLTSPAAPDAPVQQAPLDQAPEKQQP